MKEIKDFPGYFISKDGEVSTISGKTLTPSVDNLGYLKVTLRKDGKSYTKRVHRLVGETYLKPIKDKHIINHKDGDKVNCKLCNLEYMSNSENTQHGYDNDLYRSKSMLPVIVTGRDGRDEREFRSIRHLSNELGVNRKTVSSILNDDRRNNYEYIFKYKEAMEAEYMNELEKIAKGVTHYEAGSNESKITTFKKALKAYGWVSNKNKRNTYVKQEIAKQQRKPSAKTQVRQVDANTPKKAGMKYFKNQRGEVYEVTPDKYKEYEDYAKANNLPFEKIAMAETALVGKSIKDMRGENVMNKKANEYLKEIYKVAANEVGPVNWNAQKEIPLGEDGYRVIKERAENIGEKAFRHAKSGAKQGAKIGKGAAKAGKAIMKTKHGKIVAGTAAATAVAKHLSDKSRDKDTKTKILRDNLLPGMIEDVKTTPIRVGSAATGLVGGLAGGALGGAAMSNLAAKKGIKNAGGVVNAAALAGIAAGSIAPMVAGAEVERKVKQKMAVKRLDKLSDKYLGRKATEKEKDAIKKLYKPFNKNDGLKTPESEVQKRRRAAEKNMKKKAFIHLSEMNKEAGEDKDKWSKKDKKGYVRNVAIGVAQDFMNAGNPLNMGSSIVGSIADAAILERSSLKLNKRLKNEQVTKDKVDKYNKTVGLKNGTTAVNAAGKIIKK